MHLTKAGVPTTASDKWTPRIQMIRHKQPAALSEFYSCGVLPGSEMYPNTTWLGLNDPEVKTYFKISLKTSTATTNPNVEGKSLLCGDSTQPRSASSLHEK